LIKRRGGAVCRRGRFNGLSGPGISFQRRYRMSITQSMKTTLVAALIAGCLSSGAFAQASDPAAAPVTHADKKAAKEQSKADKKASVAQAKADKKKTDAQAEADKASADANLKDAKKQ
jgi:uncharacterized membrane protein YqiK